MTNTNRPYPSKILLFGEYTLLLGSSALGLPFERFFAELRFGDRDQVNHSGHVISSNKHLYGFYNYLDEHPELFSHLINTDIFKEELDDGIYLHSTIPAGYGLGSSGALVAAVFERYAKNPVIPGKLDNQEYLNSLKDILAMMESFFHGKSSGFDPLISLLNNQVILKPGGIPELINLPDSLRMNGAGIFLLNTGQTGKTSPLVHYFLERYKPQGEITGEGLELSSLVNSVVEAFVDYSAGDFWRLMKQLSYRQLNEFHPMIPHEFIPLWEKGLELDLFYLKLCGSGGGGFLTGFSKEPGRALEFLQTKTALPAFLI